MPRSVKMSWASSRYVLGRDDGIRVRIELSEPNGVPVELFAYRLSPQNADFRAQFSHVCSPTDLEEYPPNAAAANAVPPWFRLSYVDLIFRSTAEAEALRQVVQEDILRLLRTLDRLAVLTPGGESTITT